MHNKKLKELEPGELAEILMDEYGLDEATAQGVENLTRQFGASNNPVKELTTVNNSSGADGTSDSHGASETVGELIDRLEIDEEVEVWEGRSE